MNCIILIPKFDFAKNTVKSVLRVDPIEYNDVPNTLRPYWKWPSKVNEKNNINGKLIPINRRAQIYLESQDEDWMLPYL